VSFLGSAQRSLPKISWKPAELSKNTLVKGFESSPKGDNAAESVANTEGRGLVGSHLVRGYVSDGVTVLVYLMEDVVREQIDTAPVVIFFDHRGSRSNP
jgi:hypothetical protein